MSQNQQFIEPVQCPIALLGNIAGSKSELFYFLDVESNLSFNKNVSMSFKFVDQFYLPPFEETTMDFLREVIQNKKCVDFLTSFPFFPLTFFFSFF